MRNGKRPGSSEAYESSRGPFTERATEPQHQEAVEPVWAHFLLGGLSGVVTAFPSLWTMDTEEPAKNTTHTFQWP